ncbi:MAG: class I SAM-dependent methyltransferase [Solidesulfovibrio sp. DCME]|uniref:class I SAM-dependent methyltransferase n=1 Tax=Solidesulfovibrio sp. DCME TaxID=3447380 RepID=UPI003D12A0CC
MRSCRTASARERRKSPPSAFCISSINAMLSSAIVVSFGCRCGVVTSPYSQLTRWPPRPFRPGRRLSPGLDDFRIYTTSVDATSFEASALFDDSSLDFVYIDGDHTLEAVEQDIKAYLPKLKVGGLLIGDDYALGGWWGAGVVKGFAKCLYEDDLKIEFVVDNQICCRKIGR